MFELEANRLLFAGALVALAPAAATFTPSPAPGHAAIAIPAPRAGWFVCDAVNAPFAALIGAPAADRSVEITLLSKSIPAGQPETESYQLGAPDPGAGQVHYALSRSGQDVGELHQFNPAAYGDLGAVRTPPFTSMKLGGRDLSCRWLAGTRLAGVGGKASYVVTQGPQGLAFRSFDYGKTLPLIRPDGAEQTTRASISIDGGSERTLTDGGTEFRFEASDLVYTIDVPAEGVAKLSITHGADRTGGDTMLASVFTPQVEAPPPPPAPLKGGWPRLSQADVWTDYSPNYCTGEPSDACLKQQMQDSDATPAAVAFSNRLSNAGTPGYISDWDNAGPVGIATVTYPFSQPDAGVWLVPTYGAPIDTTAYALSAEDKQRPDVRGVLKQFPTAYISHSGNAGVTPQTLPGGGHRVLWSSYLTVCESCQPQGDVTVGFDFDSTGKLTHAGVVAMH